MREYPPKRSSPASAWTGTYITFEITRRSVPPRAKEKTYMMILILRHSGWYEASEFIGYCNFQWGVALQKLKQVCESPPTHSPPSTDRRKE
jgi:hypothetical protein